MLLIPLNKPPNIWPITGKKLNMIESKLLKITIAPIIKNHPIQKNKINEFINTIRKIIKMIIMKSLKLLKLFLMIIDN